METKFKKSTAAFGCYVEDGNKQNKFIKTEDFTISDVLNADVSIRDKFWFVRYNCNLSNDQYREIAIGCALVVLPIYEKKYPENKAPREAIQAAKYYLAGLVDIDFLIKKRSAAAADAAYAYAYAAAAAAAAAADAADAAAYAAAYAAADAAAAANYKNLLLQFFKDYFNS